MLCASLYLEWLTGLLFWYCYLIIRVHHLALIMHNVEFASLGLHANLITQWGHWAIVHLHLPWLMCQSHLTLWDLQLVHLPHHLHLQSCGQNLFQDPARTLFHLECPPQWAHRVDQLVQPFHRVDLLLIQLYNSRLRVLALHLVAAMAAQSPILQTKQHQVIPFLFFFVPTPFYQISWAKTSIFFGGSPQKEVHFSVTKVPRFRSSTQQL